MAKNPDNPRERFIAAIRETGNISEAVKLAKIPRSTAYQWREKDEAFAKQWDEAIEEATDTLEREARRRAIEGWDEPVFYKGAEQGRIRKYSDRLLEILLRAHRPEKFRERVQVEHEIGANLAQRLEGARKRVAQK